MNRQPTPKVIGAFVVGFAIVATAYVLSNFGKPPNTGTTITTVQAQEAAARRAIQVTDEDGNGVEDWRDEFVTTERIVVDRSEGSKPYTDPETITGQTGIVFVQNVIRSRSYGGDEEALLEQTVNSLAEKTAIKIYDTPDIFVITEYNNESIRTYANTLATAIMENNKSDLDYELYILQDVLNRQDEGRLEELRELAEIYRLTRDAIVEIPVPAIMAKEHLDLINTLHAIHHDILAMTYAFDDPAQALLRLKRYEGDIFGMVAALENIFTALEPYASLFTTADPAVFFVQFNPTNRLTI